jgi:hypothetical protein
MTDEKREAIIAGLENDIELKTQEIKAKEKELTELKIAKKFEELGIDRLNPGDIITVKETWGLCDDNLMKIEKIWVDGNKVTISGCGFRTITTMKWTQTTIDTDWGVCLSNDQFGQVPRIEKKTIDDWNSTIDKINKQINGMKC